MLFRSVASGSRRFVSRFWEKTRPLKRKTRPRRAGFIRHLKEISVHQQHGISSKSAAESRQKHRFCRRWRLRWIPALPRGLSTTQRRNYAYSQRLAEAFKTPPRKGLWPCAGLSARPQRPRPQAKVNREAAELSARLVESLQRNNGDILYTFYDMFVPKGAGLGK